MLWLSQLLGRIYLLTYYRNLGIPISEIRLSAIDYSVVSANVTVLAVGFAVVSAANLWWTNSVNFTLLSGKWQQFLGLLLILAGVALVHVTVSNPTQLLDHGSVSFGLLGSGHSVIPERSGIAQAQTFRFHVAMTRKSGITEMSTLPSDYCISSIIVRRITFGFRGNFRHPCEGRNSRDH